MACKHILVFFDSCGHREDRIEHVRWCTTDNPRYFETFPTTAGNFLEPDDYEYERPPVRPCVEPICATEIRYEVCHSCEIINRYTAGPHPHRLSDAEIEERRQYFDRTQGARNPEALRRRVEMRAERYRVAFDNFKDTIGENYIFVEAEGDISTSQQQYLTVIDQAALAPEDGDCPICNIPITEPGGFAPEETPETANEIRQLPCVHNFHLDCIKPWLNRHHNCPLCRKKWLWYNCPAPSWEDPVFERCLVAPSFARQISGHVPFSDPTTPVPFWNGYLNLEHAQALFGFEKCTVIDPPDVVVSRDVRLVRELIAAGLGNRIVDWFQDMILDFPEDLFEPEEVFE